MTRIRISACSIGALAGSDTTSGNSKSQSDITGIANAVQAYSGNKIGHNPLIPRIFVPPQSKSQKNQTSKKKAPSSIKEVMAWFHGSNLTPRNYPGLYCHEPDEEGKARLIKSEFREMISIGCALITHHYDVETQEIGFQDENGKWKRYTYQELANKLEVSLIRIRRFFRILKKRGHIKIIREYTKKWIKGKEVFISSASRKILMPAFFIETLGRNAWNKIVKLRDWKRKQAKPVTKKQKENVSMLSGLFKSMANTFGVSRSRNQSQASVNRQREHQTQITKQQMAKAKSCYDLDPSKTLTEWLKFILSHST